MELLHARCAALDIGKKDLKACVRLPPGPGRKARRQEVRTFATTTNALLELRDRLIASQVTLVVLEATGDYWRGAFYLLEDDLNVIVVNAAHAKGLPGRKTDVADSAWLIEGERDVHVLAEMAKARMRTRIPDLVEALRGDFQEHHAFLCRIHLERIDQLTDAIIEVSGRIEEEMRPLPTKSSCLRRSPASAARSPRS